MTGATTGIQVRIHPRSSDFCPSFLPQSEGNRPRDPRLATADRRSQAETPASTVESVRPTILDYPALRLVPMDRSPSLVAVKPETVVGWHRAGFRLFWKWRSRAPAGRPKTTAEIRALIRRLAEENATWGAPRSMENSRNWASSSPSEP